MAAAAKPECYLALLHYPVMNKHGQVVTTAVANMDIHDIARAARTYDIAHYYIVTPVAAQRDLVRTVLGHWQQGYGATYNPSRREAFNRVAIGETLEDILHQIEERSGFSPRIVVTGAALDKNLISCRDLQIMLAEGRQPYLLVFGTGWGLAESVIARADYCLAPVRGAAGDYNHLAVRSAVAIVLDRLYGCRED